MRKKTLCLAIALLGTAGFVSTATAGVGCSGGKGCKVDNGASRAQASAASGAMKAMPPPPVFYSPPLVAPIHTLPLGQTYGRWASEWYQWVLGIPAAVNPLLDQTGANCGQRQVDAVWFLGGVPGSGSATRTCKIPAGKALFFPLINTAYFAFLSDPPETRTEAFARAAGSCTEPVNISVTIDGFRLPKPERYFTGPAGSQSPIFNVQLPPGNLFGVDETVVPDLALTPSAEQGYYLFMWPLKPGKHTIKWQASGCTAGASQDITYYLNVVR